MRVQVFNTEGKLRSRSVPTLSVLTAWIGHPPSDPQLNTTLWVETPTVTVSDASFTNHFRKV